MCIIQHYFQHYFNILHVIFKHKEIHKKEGLNCLPSSTASNTELSGDKQMHAISFLLSNANVLDLLLKHLIIKKAVKTTLLEKSVV